MAFRPRKKTSYLGKQRRSSNLILSVTKPDFYIEDFILTSSPQTLTNQLITASSPVI